MAQNDLAVPENRMKVQIPKNRFFGTKGEVTLRYIAESDSYSDNILKENSFQKNLKD